MLADIPGLIEGASDGKGLGHKFLRHIKRTSTLVHLVSAENENVGETYTVIRNELGKYDEELLSRHEIVVLSKSDMVTDEEVAVKKKELEKATGKEVLILSLFDETKVKAFGDFLIKVLAK